MNHLDATAPGSQYELSGHARGKSDRRFRLNGPSADAELEGLLGLADFLQDDLEARALLACMTEERIRRHFPAERAEVRSIQCASGLTLRADMADTFAASASFGVLPNGDEFSAFMAMIQPGSTVIDVGASFGLYAAHAALYSGSTGRVIAFEPHPRAYAHLVENARANDLDYRAIQSAVGIDQSDGSSRSSAQQSSDPRDTGRCDEPKTSDACATTLDTFDVTSTLNADLVRISVKGDEEAVLRGARGLLARSAGVLVMLEPSEADPDAYSHQALIAELSFQCRNGFALYRSTLDDKGLQRTWPIDLFAEGPETLFLTRPDSESAHRLIEVLSRPKQMPTAAQVAAIGLIRRCGQIARLGDALRMTILEMFREDIGGVPPADAFQALAAYRAITSAAIRQAEARERSRGRAPQDLDSTKGLHQEVEASLAAATDEVARLQQLTETQRQELAQALEEILALRNTNARLAEEVGRMGELPSS